jgi:hypothetical protein
MSAIAAMRKLPSLIRDDARHDGQTSASSTLAESRERMKHPLDELRREPRTVVFNLERPTSVLAQSTRSRGTRRRGFERIPEKGSQREIEALFGDGKTQVGRHVDHDAPGRSNFGTRARRGTLERGS